MRIVSMNFAQSDVDCRPHEHYMASFPGRAVTDFVTRYERRLRLRRIYCDYFRFPTPYMVQAYVPFLRSMLPELVK